MRFCNIKNGVKMNKFEAKVSTQCSMIDCIAFPFKLIGRGISSTVHKICSLCSSIFNSLTSYCTRSSEVPVPPKLTKKVVDLTEKEDSNKLATIINPPPANTVGSPLLHQPKAVNKIDLSLKAIQPKLLFYDIPQAGNMFNFVKLNINNKPTLVSIIRQTFDGKYRFFNGSLKEALFQLAKTDPFNFSFSCLLNHPDNDAVTTDEFIHYVLGKDENNVSRLFSLSPNNLLAVLKTVIDKKIPINLQEKNSKGETLFISALNKPDSGTKWEIARLFLDYGV